MTPAQMETMVKVAFQRIFGREPERSGHIRGWPARNGSAYASDDDGRIVRCGRTGAHCEGWVKGSSIFGEQRFASSPAAALRYAEAAFCKSFPPPPQTRPPQEHER